MLSDYVNWYNNIRIHLSLGYLTPDAYRKLAHKKAVEKVLTIQNSEKLRWEI